MWRGALFSALLERRVLEGAWVWDLYAGTGVLGLECLSRGAEGCVFVERDAATCKSLRNTIAGLQATERTEVQQVEVDRFITAMTSESRRWPDLVFADPPYALRVGNRLLSMLEPVVVPGGLLILEHSTTEALLPHEAWQVEWSRERGPTILEFLERVG
jgi:16S rRNA (guanine966-N2)-methyltransferase